MSSTSSIYGEERFLYKKWLKGNSKRNNPFDPIPNKWQFLKVETVLKRHPDWSYDKVPVLNSPKQVNDFIIEVLQDIGSSDRERLYAMFFDLQNHPIGIHQVTIGSATGSIAPPRELFRAAIIANATRIIFAHNHPAGDAFPSEEDLKMMNKLIQVGDLVEMKVMDFLVIGSKGKYWSYEEWTYKSKQKVQPPPKEA